ncbi:MAG: hypothetical protein ACRCXC_07135 [Legionella sp.]
MSQKVKTLLTSVCIVLFSQMACADPWFTGPILAAAGHTIPRGHTNLEVYGFDTFVNGQYNNSGHVVSTPLFKSVSLLPLLTHGFTDWLDVQIAVPSVFNSTKGESYNRIADTSLGIGLQFVEQRKHQYLPDIRFFVQETFPTGKYENLNPELLGTDATGLGSYRTLLALNFQYLAEVYAQHYIRTRLILSRTYYSSVQVMGFDSFGGSEITNGTADLGTDNNIDLAFEYTLTQNWVAVMEGYYSDGTPILFDGVFTPTRKGHNLNISGHFYEVGLAPAIEYNFTSNVGVIGGVWFPVAGQNTSHFLTYVMAINAYW